MNVESLAQELAAHLVLTRPLVCVDLEATGVWPGRDRIVQIATASVSPDGSVSTWSSLVNPEQPIPPGATAIHGISDEMVASEPTFKQLSSTIAGALSDCDLTGHNVERFDRRCLHLEVSPVGGKWWRWKYRFGGKEKRLSLGVDRTSGVAPIRTASPDLKVGRSYTCRKPKWR